MYKKKSIINLLLLLTLIMDVLNAVLTNVLLSRCLYVIAALVLLVYFAIEITEVKNGRK